MGESLFQGGMQVMSNKRFAFLCTKQNAKFEMFAYVKVPDLKDAVLLEH